MTREQLSEVSPLCREEAGASKAANRKQKKRGNLYLFRYAGPVEVLMMLVGTLAQIAEGGAPALIALYFGDSIDVFIDTGTPDSNSNQTFADGVHDAMNPLLAKLFILSSVALVGGCLGMALWMRSGQRQIAKIRKHFFRAVMRQDMTWFDTYQLAELNSQFSEDICKISEGVGDNVAVCIKWCSLCITSYMIALTTGWKLTLVASTCIPLMMVAAAFYGNVLRNLAEKEQTVYAKAGAVVEEALRSIRTVYAFQGQEKEQKKYDDNLVTARKVGKRTGMVAGFGEGITWAILYFCLSLTFCYGTYLVQHDDLNYGDIIVVLMSTLMATFSLGFIFPNFQTFIQASVAVEKVSQITELQPSVDISSAAGRQLGTLKGVIEFKDVRFGYPARPDVQVLKGLSVKVQPGETVALVGPSGCGKSTTIQLLQRFYDPEGGQVTVDGHNVKDLNLKWLRDQIGVVNQEPVLFATTIADNIRYGNPDATQEQIVVAAMKANVHDFITSLPQSYYTVIGERGTQLSGGQKQRIAIARALVQNPRILLLDEATSALDNESEALVQNALEKASKGRTTIVIAHRLSTIHNADKIVAVSNGRKAEEGTHQQLMARDGLYAQLVNQQMIAAEQESEDGTDVELEKSDQDGNLAASGSSGKQFFRSKSTSSEKAGAVSGSGYQRLQDENQMSTDINKERGEEEERETQSTGSFKRLMRMNSPEWPFIVVGAIVTMICGLSPPSFTFIYGELFKMLAIKDEDEQMERAFLLSGIVIGIGLLLGPLRAAAGYCLGKAGAELTARMRSLTFRSLLEQDMEFYDDEQNQVGTLTTTLATDGALIQKATGPQIAAALEALTTVVGCMTIAFIYGWKMALVSMAFLPLCMANGMASIMGVSASGESGQVHVKEMHKLFSEAVDNIRTVVSLNQQDTFVYKLETILDSASGSMAKTALMGIMYSVANNGQWFALATAMAYGTDQIANRELDFYDVFRIFFSFSVCGISVGRTTSLSSNYKQTQVAAARLFAIMDRKSAIDTNQRAGLQLDKYRGRVGLDRVVFHYPTRNTVQVLSGLSLVVEPGQTLALVGSSGCGKSTVLQLLQRFYDTDFGALLIDGHDLRTLNLRWFRQQLGIVSQEPTLFDDSIAANIAYGDNSRYVPMDEIIAAARAANIHTFIESLPLGYDTNVGDKGTQLSGGQKQRVAIARALVRQPKVLLLDEATSALDTESERIVQETLDKARQGRTCIVIAHNLATIHNADRIAVIEEGRVLEIGTHSELLAKEGAYFRMHMRNKHARRTDDC